MYYKINPTGCTERNGLVQVRFDCYLDPLDPGTVYVWRLKNGFYFVNPDEESVS
jgi:hypothetical protein